MRHYDIDVGELAAWLEAQGRDRLWAIDGEHDIAGEISVPCTAEDLAQALRRHAGTVRVYASPENEPAGPLNRQNLESVAEHDGDARAFRLAWTDGESAGDSWDLVEDTIAAESMSQDDLPHRA
jgi:hypothetical protein